MNEEIKTTIMTLYFNNGKSSRFRILQGSYETVGDSIRFVKVVDVWTKTMEIVTFKQGGFAGISFPIKAEDALSTDREEKYRDPILYGDIRM